MSESLSPGIMSIHEILHSRFFVAIAFWDDVVEYMMECTRFLVWRLYSFPYLASVFESSAICGIFAFFAYAVSDEDLSVRRNESAAMRPSKNDSRPAGAHVSAPNGSPGDHASL